MHCTILSVNNLDPYYPLNCIAWDFDKTVPAKGILAICLPVTVGVKKTCRNTNQFTVHMFENLQSVTCSML